LEARMVTSTPSRQDCRGNSSCSNPRPNI
jgi:hypothetical protein